MNKSHHSIRILAVCTGNICRSPMAEGILRRIFSGNPGANVSSAGTHALDGNPATEFAVIAAFENSIDISGHSARMLTAEMVRESGAILCMEPLHAEWVLSLDVSAYDRTYDLADFSGSGRRLTRISDPYGCSLREYRECFKDIQRCLDNFVTSCKLPK